MKKRLKLNPVAAYYLKKARKYPLYLWSAILCIPFTVFLNTYLPTLILARVLGRLSAHDYVPHDVWGSFGPTLVFYFIVLVGSTLAWRVVDHFVWRLEWNIEQDIAEEVFDHMLDESADFHANHFGGSLVSANNKLISGYVRVADTTTFQVYPMFVGIVVASIVLWPRSPQYVIVLITASMIFLAFAFLISGPVRRLSARRADAESRQTGFLADAITNIMAIKSFARGKFELERFHKATNLTKQRTKKLARMHQVQMTVLATSSRVMSWLALLVAIISVLAFDANLATVFLIFSFTAGIAGDLFNFSNNSLRNYNRAFGDAEDMVNILQEIPQVLDPTNPEQVRISSGDIAFKHVNFTHSGSDGALFDDLSVDIKHGEKIGLVGHSGSGKTTFTRILLRFSDIDGGAIEIDGQNIAKITQANLHENIAYVPQEPLLFHRTISENIAYGQPDADQKAIEKAATMSHATEFVDLLPQGYETLVGERGVKLSGGQRQRIAIARAMLKNAPILALDEATSALDSESEVLIQDALWKLMEDRTAIVIAHRLSTIQKMDRILVMEDGKIVEQGSHKELIGKKGTYAQLWAHQSGGFLEE